MRKIMNRLFILSVLSAFLLLITCCKESTRNQVSLLEISPNTPTDHDWLAIADTTIIPLETTEECLLGQISEIYNVDSEWYILTHENNVLKFDKSGKYISSIGKRGNGPGEFLRINAMAINDGKIYLIEGNQQKVCVYDTDGKWMEDIAGTDCLKFAMAMKASADGRFLVVNGISFKKELPLFGVWDPSEPQQLCPVVETDYTSHGSYGWALQPMASYRKDFLALKPLSSTVYHLNPETAQCDSLINIADILPTERETSGEYQKALSGTLSQKGNPIMGVATAGDFALITMLKSFAMVYLPTGEWWYTKTIGMSMQKAPLPFMLTQIGCSVDNSVVCVVEASTYLNVYAEKPEFGRLCHTEVDSEDNPVLMIYTLKFSGE